MVELGSWMVGLVELVEGEKVLLDRIMGEEMGGKYNVVVKVWDEKTWFNWWYFWWEVMVVVHPFLIELEFR